MNSNRLIWLGVFLGSIIGGYIPNIWGASVFSMSGILFSGLGSIAGIYIAYRLQE